MEDDWLDMDTIINIPELHVYRIPKSQIPGEYKAKFWGVDGDLSKPYFTGSGKLTLKKEVLYLQIFRDTEVKSNETLFATCTIDILEEPAKESKLHFFCEPVVDSSRYYVLRIIDPSGKKEARIGIGFTDRDMSSTFLMCLQEQVRSIKRSRTAAKEDEFDAFESEDFDGESTKEKRSDYSIEEGSTITIKLGKSKSKQKKSKRKKKKKTTNPGNIGILNPPESCVDEGSKDADKIDAADDTWGDFTSSYNPNSTTETTEDGWGDFTTG